MTKIFAAKFMSIVAKQERNIGIICQATLNFSWEGISECNFSKATVDMLQKIHGLKSSAKLPGRISSKSFYRETRANYQK